MTSNVPAAEGAVVALSWVELTNVTAEAFVPPKNTCAPEAKPVPVTTTTLPPAFGPAAGLTPVIDGGGSR